MIDADEAASLVTSVSRVGDGPRRDANGNEARIPGTVVTLVGEHRGTPIPCVWSWGA